MDILLPSPNTDHLDATTDVPNFVKICIMVDLLTEDHRQADTWVDMVSTYGIPFLFCKEHLKK